MVKKSGHISVANFQHRGAKLTDVMYLLWGTYCTQSLNIHGYSKQFNFTIDPYLVYFNIKVRVKNNKFANIHLHLLSMIGPYHKVTELKAQDIGLF